MRSAGIMTLTIVVLLALASQECNAVIEVSITTTEGNGADSYIRSSFLNDAANVNFGSESIIAVKHDTGLPGNNRKGYIRFDLTSITDPIVDASLGLIYAWRSGDRPANPSTYYVYGLIDGHPGENWNESTITWNNAPANDRNSAGGFLAAETIFLGSYELSFPGTEAGDEILFTSNELVSFLQNDTDGLVTLMLTRQQRNFSIESFASKESALWSAPTLSVTVPEPATIAILSLGGLLLRRRR